MELLKSIVIDIDEYTLYSSKYDDLADAGNKIILSVEGTLRYTVSKNPDGKPVLTEIPHTCMRLHDLIDPLD